MWRNWQTRWIQVPVKAISYGFKSLHLHQKTKERACPSLLFFHTNNTLELQFALRIALLRAVMIESEETQAQKGFLSPFICTKKQSRGLTPLFCFFVRIGKVEAKITGGVKECEVNQDLNTPFTHLSSSLFTE